MFSYLLVRQGAVSGNTEPQSVKLHGEETGLQGNPERSDAYVRRRKLTL